MYVPIVHIVYICVFVCVCVCVCVCCVRMCVNVRVYRNLGNFHAYKFSKNNLSYKKFSYSANLYEIYTTSYTLTGRSSLLEERW